MMLSDSSSSQSSLLSPFASSISSAVLQHLALELQALQAASRAT
jgi:hypothetical protein